MSEQIPYCQILEPSLRSHPTGFFFFFFPTFISVDKDAAASPFILNLVLMSKTWPLVQKRVLETEF